MKRADILRSFFAAALERFRASGADPDLLHWLLGSALASFPARRRELEVRRGIAEALCATLRGRVLDVGCGTGIFSLFFASVPGVEEVVAVDTAEGFAVARDVAPGLGLPVRFVPADFLDFHGGGRFDRVVFLWVLHDCADPRPFLERAREVLAPEGAIAVGDVDFGGLREAIREFGMDAGLEVEIADRGELMSHGRPARAFLARLWRG